MIAIMKRNLKVFFRDRASVFFSFLGVIIIIGLYVLFLGDMVSSEVKSLPSGRFLMDSWIMAGMLAVTSITTTMGAFGVMVEDRSKKILKDFFASPLRRSALTAGYISSSYIVGVILTIASLVFAELYILLYGGSLLPWAALIKVLGLILLSVLACSAMVFFLISFFKSVNAFATASTILGTLIGFLTGIYIPLGVLPGPVQMVIKSFPVSHAGALFRQIMMEAPMKEAFGGAAAQAAPGFKAEMGVTFTYGSHTMAPWEHLLVLVATALVFYALALYNVSRKRKL